MTRGGRGGWKATGRFRWVGRGGWVGRLAAGLPALALAGCAGATLGSGVGEARFEHAPYYAGSGGTGAGTEIPSVAYAPVTWQPGATQDEIFDPSSDEGSPVARLLDAMNGHLEDLARSGTAGLVGPAAVSAGTAPDVQFGCETEGWDECVMTEAEDGFGPGRPRMRLAVARPDDVWTLRASEEMARTGAASLVVITLEIGQYWPRQTNWRGSKAIELGTDHVVALPWLTALDAPVAVLQLTGALMGPDGKARRIGAEGLLARRTPIVASGFGAQALLTDQELEALLRPGDGGGEPVWRTALRTLLVELTSGAVDVSGAH